MNSLKNTVHELDFARGSMFLNKILIEDITQEIAHFSEEATNMDSRLAPFFMNEAQSKLRLLTTLLQTARDDMNRDFENLNSLVDLMFDEVVRGKNNGSHVYPFQEIHCASQEREKEIAMSYNRKAFVAEFGKEPESDEEVKAWITDVMAKIDEKKPSNSHCSGRESR